MMNATQQILVVDDDPEIRDLLSKFLRKHGFRVVAARDGRQMREMVSQAVDLIILDLLLPDEDGLSLCRELRSKSETPAVPIIMLTAIGEDTDRILGLEMGADDYIPKPFNPRELLARMKAVLRRSEGNAGNSAMPGESKVRFLLFAGWKLDLVRRELQSPVGVMTELSTGEYDLLLAFVDRPQRVLSRDQLLDLARNRATTPFDRSIDVQVSRLRRKIENEDGDPLIKTVRGVGYMFTAAVERA